jgi:hypothetical protein
MSEVTDTLTLPTGETIIIRTIDCKGRVQADDNTSYGVDYWERIWSAHPKGNARASATGYGTSRTEALADLLRKRGKDWS